jgi:tetratricopeptide (TPR) repeat protein
MMLLTMRRLVAVAGMVLLSAQAAAAQWPPDSLTNLKVLPKDITVADLVNVMSGFTRALGVRCTYCHVGEEGQDIATYRFASDDKPAKRKARTMLQLVQDVNGRYLSALETRQDPPVRVECVTCHRGTTAPRTLRDVLLLAYRAKGLDSVITAYRGLRTRYYGRSTYDFGEVPLADVASQLWDQERAADAVALFTLNVEMNPTSGFAERLHASYAITRAFGAGRIDSGAARYRELKAAYGASVFAEGLMNQVGYRLLNAGQADLAIAAFTLNVEAFPQSANAYDSLGDGYAKRGDKQRAIETVKALALDPASAGTRKKLDALRMG